MTVVFTLRAQRDLTDIRSHIAADRPQAAARMAAQLVQASLGLEQFPDRGRKGAAPGTRELTTVRPYIIVYRVAETRIEILSIWHGRQDRSPGDG